MRECRSVTGDRLRGGESEAAADRAERRGRLWRVRAVDLAACSSIDRLIDGCDGADATRLDSKVVTHPFLPTR